MLMQLSLAMLAVGCSDDTTDEPANLAPSQLDPVPEDQLGCAGPSYQSDDVQLYDGQCCVKLLCYDSGTDACVPAEQSSNKVSGFPPGSGECTCTTASTGPAIIDGPYAAPASEPNANCCYLVGEISCVGRAMLVAGQLLLAPVVRRDDWLMAA